MKKSNVAVQAEIVKQSAKAVQVKLEQGTFWFPKKNVEFDESGAVIAVSKKMLETKITEQVENKAWQKSEAEWRANGWVKEPRSRIVKETEKAVQVKFEAWLSSPRHYGELDVTMWFPKSLTKIEENSIMIKAWAFLRASKEKAAMFEDAREFEVNAHDENGILVRG